MNVFLLHDEPYRAAYMHHDKHVVKMPLESAQMISTALRLIYERKPSSLIVPPSVINVLYEKTHEHHPWVKWLHDALCDALDGGCDARAKMFLWHSHGLSLVYKLRYGRDHASRNIIVLAMDLLGMDRPSPIGRWSDFETPLCMPDKYKVKGFSNVDCYRLYYMGEKMEGQSWTSMGMIDAQDMVP